MRTDIENLKPGDEIELYLDGTYKGIETVIEPCPGLVLETERLDFTTRESFTGPGYSFTVLEERKAPTHQVDGVGEEITADLLTEREQDYGDAATSFERIASYWSTHLGDRLSDPLTPKDVALMMVLMKVSRTKTSPDKADNWDDIIGYGTLGREL